MSGRARLAATLIATSVIVAACGGSPSPSPSASGSDVAGPSDGTAGPSDPGVSFGDDLPAGVQVEQPSVVMPPDFRSVFAEMGDRVLIFGRANSLPAVAERAGDSWNVTSFDPGPALALPAGYGYQSTPPAYFVTAAAGSDDLVVAVGSTSITNPAFPQHRSLRQVSVLWSSADGVTFVRFDPRDILGGPGVTVQVVDVKAVAGGFVATGSVAPANGSAPSEAFILRSTDGRTWSEAARIGDPWSLAGRTVHVGEERLVVAGTLHACDAAGAAQTSNLAPGAVVVAWESLDGGEQWEIVDLSGADEVMAPPEPPPSTAAGCPPATDFQAINARFAATGSLLGLADDRLVAQHLDGAHTASETGSGWVVTELPGARASAGPDGAAPREPSAVLLTAEAETWLIRSLQPRRDADDAQRMTGCHVYWWYSTDGGAEWTAGELAKPIKSCAGAIHALRPLSDGSVRLYALAVPVTPPPLISSYFESVAGPVEPWDDCDPGPDADCTFATITAPSGDGVNWSLIDLFGAEVTGAELDGANLTRAILSGALLDGSFAGANFQGSFFFDTDLRGDYSGADFTVSNVHRTRFDAELVGANFSGMTLSLVTFSGDLTDANFAGTVFSSVSFTPGTTCPDGAPATPAAGQAACRL